MNELTGERVSASLSMMVRQCLDNDSIIARGRVDGAAADALLAVAHVEDKFSYTTVDGFDSGSFVKMDDWHVV